MKKRVMCVLLAGILTALIYQQSMTECPSIDAAEGMAQAQTLTGEELKPSEPVELQTASDDSAGQPMTVSELQDQMIPTAGSMPKQTGEAQAEAEEDEPAPEEDVQEPESEYANLAIAQVDHYVNVRQEPNTDSRILGKIYNGAVAQILETAGENQDWFHVVSGSVEGYIKAEFFLYGDAAVEAVDNYVTRYATVNVDRLNVRQEQSTDSKRIGYIDRGEKVKVLELLGDWLLVQYTDSKTGYVAAEYVTVSEEFIYAKSIEEERAEEAARRELAARMAAEEQHTPESIVTMPLNPPETTYTSNEELRSSIVEYAMQYLGYPYVHGGRSLAGGTDCSGFTCYIYADFGYSISRTPSGQYNSDGRSIDYSEIQPGDIICYGKGKCTHVALYIGNGQIIHAANSRKGVVIYDADYDTIMGIKNIID
ncbi:MAG: SH3 domain-containing protein [Acetatifactor sp.]|nr:SH3 domain-containing protein [Acetatifactor sp.]